jgi:prepilin-type N-terminal cleavage/methylation domain-containing protein
MSHPVLSAFVPKKSLLILHNQRGLTLLESALVLAILGIVIAGVWVLSGAAFGGNKKNDLGTQIISTVESSRNYLRQVDLAATTITTQTAWDLGLLSSNLRRAGTYANAYGGSFSINLSNSQILIALERIPTDACVDLLYARLGGSGDAANNMGLLGYGSPTIVNDFSFNAVTSYCQDSASKEVRLQFSP